MTHPESPGQPTAPTPPFPNQPPQAHPAYLQKPKRRWPLVLMAIGGTIAVIGVIGVLVRTNDGTDTSKAAAVTSTTAVSTMTTSSQPAPTATSSPAEPEGSKTPQGWLIKKIGETAGYGGTSLADTPIKFTVDKVETNPKCAPYGDRPASGRKIVVLHVSMTTKQLNQDEALAAGLVFNPYSLKGVTPDGFVHDATPSLCLMSDSSFPSSVASNSKYRGTIELELPEAVTMVASVPDSFDTSGGWAWPIT